MKALIVGSGAREHALAWAFAKRHEIACAPGNAGTAGIARNIGNEGRTYQKVACACDAIRS